MVDAQPVLDHMLALSEKGIGYRRLAELSGVGNSTLLEIRTGRRSHIRARNARRVLAVTGIGDHASCALVDATETWRLIGQLIDEGFTKGRIAAELGYKTRALQIGRKRCCAKSAKAVRALWRRYMV